jgi:hypothetical protein
MADNDEYDELLEEPFGEDVDWTAIEGMAGPLRGIAGEQQDIGSESEAYFDNDDGVMDEAFLAEIRQLEDRITADMEAGLSRGEHASPSLIACPQ